MRQAAAAVLLAVLTLCGCAATGMHTGRNASEDKALAARVKAALIRDPEIEAAPIAVTAEHGHIRLHGFVASEAERRQAEQKAGRVKGVKGVTNAIEVK